MKHRVRRVFESGLEALLSEIDQKGAELIRIIPLPTTWIRSKECSECTTSMCPGHRAAWLQLLSANPQLNTESAESLKVYMDETGIYLPRYAVVYKESSVLMDNDQLCPETRKPLCGVWVREMGPCVSILPCKAHPDVRAT